MKPAPSPSLPASPLDNLRSFMLDAVIGQDEAMVQIVDSMAKVEAGLNDPDRPLLTMLLAGPTGVGKTETVRSLAEAIFGNRRGYLFVNGPEFSSHYNVSKLLGSPPGYVGGEITPLFSKTVMGKAHRGAIDRGAGMISNSMFDRFDPEDEEYVSIVLFDEIEKAHRRVWDILLSIMEDGELTLAQNEITDFRRTIFVITTNVGSQAIDRQIAQAALSFTLTGAEETSARDLRSLVNKEIRKTFPPELINRLDAVIPYRALLPADLGKIIDVLIKRLHSRCLSCTKPFQLSVNSTARRQLVGAADYRKYGARPLKRLLEREVVVPLSYRVASGKIQECDLVIVGHTGQDYTFEVVTNGMDSTCRALMNNGKGHIMDRQIAPSVEPGNGRARRLSISYETGDD